MITYRTVSDFYWSADCPEADLSDLPTWPSFAWADLRLPIENTSVLLWYNRLSAASLFFVQHPCYFTKFNCRYINKFGIIDQTALQFLLCKHHSSRYLLSQIMLHPRCKILPNNNSNGMRWRHMPAVDVRESSCCQGINKRHDTQRPISSGGINRHIADGCIPRYRGKKTVVKLCL